MNQETLDTAKKIDEDLAAAHKALGVWAEVKYENHLKYDPHPDEYMFGHSYYPSLPEVTEEAFDILKESTVKHLEEEVARCKELIAQL